MQVMSKANSMHSITWFMKFFMLLCVINNPSNGLYGF